MGEIFIIVLGGILAGAGWLYQKAWERQEKKIAHYGEILDRLSALTVSGKDPDKIDEALVEFRKLWLIAPDDVVKFGQLLFDSTSGIGQDDSARERALSDFVLAMRKDSSFFAALLPRFLVTKLTPDLIKISVATRR